MLLSDLTYEDFLQAESMHRGKIEDDIDSEIDYINSHLLRSYSAIIES